ncbi:MULTISPECIES: hypothetical protein [unclassified Mesorhizobium]|uniref:hypothetical protein n=1 Tax=unclassified Mesorhizobium TaxID=325217 RepID=UPI000FCA6DD0|nr:MULTISPECIES: hypothetical protein [unclassified Mesorhizobium]RUT80938.1 hypothetical protein EOD15_33895 [Mesorhizobium sp. M7A.T.Ca.US.000.02.2.1]RUT88022.1 hypothetical protein EOD14_08290 [Mesorhizobium sp. M7A.T.Ca.US.000.02.1.1]
MSKANSSLLETIHGLIAEDMRKRLEAGECEAKDWAVIVKFLKDNNIDADIEANKDAEDSFNQLVQAAQRRISQTASDLQ